MVEDAPDVTAQLSLPESLYSFQATSSRNVVFRFAFIVRARDFCDQNWNPLVGSGLSISDNYFVRKESTMLVIKHLAEL